MKSEYEYGSTQLICNENRNRIAENLSVFESHPGRKRLLMEIEQYKGKEWKVAFNRTLDACRKIADGVEGFQAYPEVNPIFTSISYWHLGSGKNSFWPRRDEAIQAGCRIFHDSPDKFRAFMDKFAI